MNNGVTPDVIKQFDYISKLPEGNLLYMMYFMATLTSNKPPFGSNIQYFNSVNSTTI